MTVTVGGRDLTGAARGRSAAGSIASGGQVTAGGDSESAAGDWADAALSDRGP